jgi:hypothetical protein
VDTTYILIDYENVQPTDIPLLDQARHKVTLLHGSRPAKMDVALAKALQPLGRSVEFVATAKDGKNALDFQLAFHAGRLLERHAAVDGNGGRSARFLIISKDAGFDALLLHIESLGYVAVKAPTIREALALAVPDLATRPSDPGGKAASPTPAPATQPRRMPSGTGGGGTARMVADPVSRALEHLRKHVKTRPSTRSALVRHLATLLHDAGAETAESVVRQLEQSGAIATVGTKVRYLQLE